MDFLQANQDDMSEEDIQKLVAMGVIPDKQAILQRQIAQAQGLRDQPMPEMRGNGRVNVAANPLEFLAKGVQNYKAGKKLEGLEGQEQGLLGEQTMGRKAFIDALRKGRTPGFNPQSDMSLYANDPRKKMGML